MSAHPLTLLVGNGLNRLSAKHGIEWSRLLTDAGCTIGRVASGPEFVQRAGQYPLLYDMLLQQLMETRPGAKVRDVEMERVERAFEVEHARVAGYCGTRVTCV